MIATNHRFGVRLMKMDGTELGVVPIRPDWDPPCRSAALTGMRSGRLPLTLSAGEPGIVEPVWHPATQEDGSNGWRSTLGFRVRVGNGGDGFVAEEFPSEHLEAFAQGASSLFVKSGALVEGETFRWDLVAASSEAEAQQPGTAPGFEFDETDEELPCVESSLSEFIARGEPQEPIHSDHMQAFIPRAVVEDCLVLARAAGDKETGGLLIGHLHRDPTIPDVFAEVTAQIQAAHAPSELTKLTFTGETWGAAHTAMALRRRDEIILGWWHSHPGAILKSDEKPAAVGGTDRATTVFLSATDVGLTRACFPAAYSLALVVGENAGQVQSWGLFGWDHGKLRWRGCYLLEGTGSDVAAPSDARKHSPEA